MLTLKDDLFTVLDKEIVIPDSIVCTTNCCLKKCGHLVMGAGIAKEFARRWPELPDRWGWQQKKVGEFKQELLVSGITHLKVKRNTLHGKPYLAFGIPTKIDWKQPSTLEIVENGIKLLVDYFIKYNYPKDYICLLPKPGCSNGGLNWNDVRPLMEKYLDDRFICCLNE